MDMTSPALEWTVSTLMSKIQFISLFFSSNCWTQVCNLSHGICLYVFKYVCYRYVELLREHKPKFKWDSDCGEHYFKYK